jgi:hypothetical protein
MATAKYEFPQETPIRQIDAYTTPLKVYAGETFEWTTTEPAGTTVIIQPIAGQSWPLTEASYSVTAGSPTAAQVNATSAGQVSQFQCSPSAPTSPQTIAVATNLYSPCNDVNIQQGQCFGWQNSTGKKVHIKGTGNWPKLHEIDNGAIVLLYVDANVAAASYPLSVSEPNGKGVCSDVAGNPKIIVTTPPVPKGNR